ncbi:hypothetical protein VOLCADRAFT_97967 [Volvox carteri f. nagariensis]|uniref:Uncharacterized protein n=1 Tax=Volvox carteri f. nagariensis TaxID=3068 RepID=D8UE37_VOLCA|nr:uncharacterized protein VOLCADRAFT_97967 [Volvox carteri f. nagariensis]EFJ42057.1 hypothetical protein VOLCADRAFT_97967 [Volvox carteri f. nagariensis]|eukprot:XP_002956932.1 hypothetical protein VOLCADRAFT_97967 [Volvox carteri f. nagariensis]
MGEYTKGLLPSSVPVAEAVLILGITLSVLSVLVLLVVLATLWLPVVGMSISLVTKRHFPAVAFVAAGAVFIAVHAVLAVRQFCWCCCAGAAFKGSSTENPKSALLKSPTSGDTHAQQGRLDSPTGSADPAGLEGRNPFHATYGMLPGSSVFAYQIFIPGAEDQLQPGGGGGGGESVWGQSKSSRHGSPGSEGRSHGTEHGRISVQQREVEQRLRGGGRVRGGAAAWHLKPHTALAVVVDATDGNAFDVSIAALLNCRRRKNKAVSKAS